LPAFSFLWQLCSPSLWSERGRGRSPPTSISSRSHTIHMVRSSCNCLRTFLPLAFVALRLLPPPQSLPPYSLDLEGGLPPPSALGVLPRGGVRRRQRYEEDWGALANVCS
jgi:hypothetical protein